jgi:hypothetical protein
VLPVVGGTGRFKGATGTVTVNEVPGTVRASNVYRLSYPADSRTVAARG